MRAALVLLGLVVGCGAASATEASAVTPAAADADADGVVGAADRCPDEPEDYDAYRDDDGCPDVDSDPQIAIDVPDDACQPDADHDGVPDASDACAAEPETYDGHDDDDGCPDGAPLATLDGMRVRLAGLVAFEIDDDEIREEGFPLLDALAALLAHHRELARVQIAGHADDGGMEMDRRLGLDRARSVIAYLVRRGVDPAILDALDGDDVRAPESRRIDVDVLAAAVCDP